MEQVKAGLVLQLVVLAAWLSFATIVAAGYWLGRPPEWVMGGIFCLATQALKGAPENEVR